MKLLRYGPRGVEKPGLMGDDGKIRDLSSHINDIEGDVLSPRGLQQLKEIDPYSLPIVDPKSRIGPPIGRVPKFIGIGLNYADHAAETGAKIPEEPIFFSKATSSIAGPHDDVILPATAHKLDWEVELAFVIGRQAKAVSPEQGIDHIAGYMVCNDLSERAWQMETTGQWIKGKSADGFGPLGPWLVTRDEISDPHVLELYLSVNGEQMQAGHTSNMVCTPSRLVSVISQYMTLWPGDVVTTGTPPGVGMARTPPRFLKTGDQISLGIEGLGEQRQKVIAAP